MTFDGTSAEPATDAPGPGRQISHGSEWRTTELAVLREQYGKAGAKGVQALLPWRSLNSIRAKAASEGIKGLRSSTLGKRFARIYPQRDDIDMAVREGYVHATARGDIKRLAERIGRPAWWVQKKAASMGLARTNRTRLDCWKAAELEIVEEFAAAGLEVIVRKLKAAGFYRTSAAVAIQIKRRQIDRTDPDRWTATQLGPLFGVNPSTVADWIQRRGLPAKQHGTGVRSPLMVDRKSIKRWIAANPAYVDLRRVDQAWFWEVMFGVGG